MTYVGRFAPSPTGPLHFGSLVAATASYLDARAAGGLWRVRIEDVDETRSVPGAADGILRQLDAFGFSWDGEVVFQSRRKHLYQAALDTLRAAGHVYRCRCSRREVADSALRGVEGAVYPGTCRTLDVDAATPGAERMRVDAGSVTFVDRVQGAISQEVSSAIGDFVLKRRDALHAYQLAVVVDDADQGITHVVRGADLLQSTPRQILLQRALGLATPRHLHFPVATDERGEKLSKQALASAADERDAIGLLRAALLFLGQEESGESCARALLQKAIPRWDVARIPKRTELVATLNPTA